METRMCADVPDSERTVGRALKRRGILAAAGAVVAGMVAKQVAEESPVSANDTVWTFPYSGSTSTTGAAFSVGNTSSNVNSSAVSGSSGSGNGVNGSSTSNTGVSGSSTNGTGVSGSSTGGFGVSGSGVVGVAGISASGTGVSGSSNGFHGVSGNTNAPTGSGFAGVFGIANGNGTFGVLGDGFRGAGIGVQGQSNDATGTGVKGISASGFPVVGVVTSGPNANAGVLGVGTSGPGVQGQSTGSHGLVGTTFATDGIHAALIGSVQPNGNAIGVRGSVQPGATGLAGMFDGNVRITGTLVAPVTQSAVKHQGDKSTRLLHTLATPDAWLEDFGTGSLAADKAVVTLDPDFAALVHVDDYHVFLTAHGPQHLHVAQQSATGFSVMAMAWATQAGGPKAAVGGGTFSYRVVAKRRDIAGERLAKVGQPPPLPPVTAFTVPETPAATPPTKQP